MYLFFSILRLLGGLLCCVGDVLFDLKGKVDSILGISAGYPPTCVFVGIVVY